MFNPYAQGGWPNTENPNASPPRGTIPQPSIFGALPYPTPVSSPTPASSPFITFRFTSLSPTILDSVVLGPQSRTHFHIITDAPMVGFTIICDSANQPTIIIEWVEHPIIEIRGILSKRRTSNWLVLSADNSYRTMTASGRTFAWGADGDYTCLYCAGLGAPQIYARVFRQNEDLVLEMTPEAVQIGLLEICVAAALLLESGRNID
ncbi:hypothetical protein B0H17DRAFT_935402 [Mycena rosella]|uniref:Uncharacterized protein n=1 Tax=Mycena rosella TaxID=1033263 RepID=A0AAD7DGX5_MYCRO|nr:hypothetical protein B0H17DRAFT_935402 [Mycena rosella]